MHINWCEEWTSNTTETFIGFTACRCWCSWFAMPIDAGFFDHNCFSFIFAWPKTNQKSHKKIKPAASAQSHATAAVAHHAPFFWPTHLGESIDPNRSGGLQDASSSRILFCDQWSKVCNCRIMSWNKLASDACILQTIQNWQKFQFSVPKGNYLTDQR